MGVVLNGTNFMSLGFSIFLSSVVLAMAGIFIATKDRWNWKKIILRSTTAIILSALVWYAYSTIHETIRQRPKKETKFWDIPLGSTKADVRFLKGQPYASQYQATLSDLQDSDFKSLPSAEQAKGRREVYYNLMKKDEAFKRLPPAERAKIVGLSSPPPPRNAK